MTTNISKELLLQSKHVETEKKYWLNKLSGELVKTYFPYDHIAQDVPTGKTGEKVNFQFKIQGDLFSRLIRLAKGSNKNLYIILLAGLTVLLSKYTGNKDIIISSPIYKQEIDGEFINTVLAIRLQVTGKESVKELILLCKKTLVEANEHLNFPIERLMDELDSSFPGKGSSFFEIGALLENIHHKKYIDHLGVNLLFSFLKTEECIEGIIEYNHRLYKKDTIAGIVEHYINLLQRILNNLELRILEIEILLEEERRRLLTLFNETQREFPTERTIQDIFEEQVEKRLKNAAVVGDEFSGFLSYTNLNEKSNQLARILRKRGVNPGTIAAVMTPTTVWTLIGIIAVLKAGGSYLPIDPEFPGERIEYMLTDSRVPIVLIQNHHPGYSDKAVELIDIDDDGIYEGEVSNLKRMNTAGDIIYVIYTSGTSGRPKGVLVKNENLVNYVSWFLKKADLTQKDKTALISSLAFDLGYTAIYPSILAGGELHLLQKEIFLSPGRLLDYIEKNGITYLKLTPSLFSVIVNSPDFSKGKCLSLRIVILGGEPINTQDVEKAHWVCHHLQIMNHYGPTETTVGSIAQFIDFERYEEYKQEATLGKPISNTEVYILEENLKPVPLGIPAELYIGGKGVGIGYLNQPELTSHKFIAHLYKDDGRLYRTGDMAKWTAYGTIHFLGRRDSQIKIRGFRVELEEIEKQLLKHQGIKNAVVVVSENESGGNYLCAYYVSSTPMEAVRLHEYLTAKLPVYMVPSFFIAIDKIPVTPNGKINHRALPKPKLGNDAQYMTPKNELQEKLGELWGK